MDDWFSGHPAFTVNSVPHTPPPQQVVRTKVGLMLNVSDFHKPLTVELTLVNEPTI